MLRAVASLASSSCLARGRLGCCRCGDTLLVRVLSFRGLALPRDNFAAVKEVGVLGVSAAELPMSAAATTSVSRGPGRLGSSLPAAGGHLRYVERGLGHGRGRGRGGAGAGVPVRHRAPVLDNPRATV